jgi:thiol:disulfide interchange protein DsbD
MIKGAGHNFDSTFWGLPNRPAALFAVALLGFLLYPVSAYSEPVRSGPVVAELVSEMNSIHPGEPFLVAVRLQMDAGWHTYWKNPGDSGLASAVSWDLPSGYSAGALQWPIPRRFESDGAISYGYTGEVLLLTRVTPPRSLRAGFPVRLRARATWLACRVECTPGQAGLELVMSVSEKRAEPNQRWAALFEEAKAALPKIAPEVQFSAFSTGNRTMLEVVPIQKAGDSRYIFLPGSPGSIADTAPQSASFEGSKMTLTLENSEDSTSPQRLQGILMTISSMGTGAIEVDAPVERRAFPGSALRSHPTSGGAVQILLSLFFAFVGGILLNLMPCVLPVLSLKVIGFVRRAQATGGGAFRHGLVFSLGVLVSFWLIVALLLALRAGGQLLGWGFQFQNPAVIAITTLLFFLIALNLFGVFEIGVTFAAAGGRARRPESAEIPRRPESAEIPRRPESAEIPRRPESAEISRRPESAEIPRREGWAGSFLSGFLATAVATPCTAPFMGSALGFALSQPIPVSLGVFTALALGVATPYLLLSASPALIGRVPKPGPWMETLKQVMGFPMMGAVVWMISVHVALSGSGPAVALLASLLAAGLGAWVYGRWGGIVKPLRSRVVAGVFAFLLIAGGAAFGIVSAKSSTGPAVKQEEDVWQRWEPDRLAKLRGEGTPVFIDFTARWCLTCQVNERIALRSDAVQRRFKELGVVTMKADWTDRNDAIAAAIAGYGRAGVPLYVLYGRGTSQPTILPEILTPSIVLDALSRMR